MDLRILVTMSQWAAAALLAIDRVRQAQREADARHRKARLLQHAVFVAGLVCFSASTASLRFDAPTWLAAAFVVGLLSCLALCNVTEQVIHGPRLPERPPEPRPLLPPDDADPPLADRILSTPYPLPHWWAGTGTLNGPRARPGENPPRETWQRTSRI